MNSLRKKKLEATILRELVLQIQKLQTKDERLEFVNVHKVELSGDFSILKIYISFFGNEKSKIIGLYIIKKNIFQIQSNLSRNLRLRATPRIILKEYKESDFKEEFLDVYQNDFIDTKNKKY